jgi:hypothetical protein
MSSLKWFYWYKIKNKPATALAINVFPTPGGPINNTPEKNICINQFNTYSRWGYKWHTWKRFEHYLYTGKPIYTKHFSRIVPYRQHIWRVSDCCSASSKQIFSYTMARTRWYPFVLDQLAQLDFYGASSLTQQSAGRHVAPLRHITLIPSQPVFALTP